MLGILHRTPHTPHPTPYTLHPTPYTLQPTPYTLRLCRVCPREGGAPDYVGSIQHLQDLQDAKLPTLEATQGQICSQSPTYANLLGVAFVWELTRETIVLPLGCLQGGDASNKPPYMRQACKTGA